jgi:hypothetical protein
MPPCVPDMDLVAIAGAPRPLASGSASMRSGDAPALAFVTERALVSGLHWGTGEPPIHLYGGSAVPQEPRMGSLTARIARDCSRARLPRACRLGAVVEVRLTPGSPGQG